MVNVSKVTGIVDEKTLAALEEATKKSNNLAGSFDNLINTVTAGDLGGRELALEGLKNIFSSLGLVLKAVGSAYRSVFPKATSEQFLGLIKKFKEFTETLKINGKTFVKIKNTFQGFFALLDIGWMAIKALGEGIAKVFGGGKLGGFLGGILDITAGLGKFIKNLRDGLKAGDAFSNISDIIAAGIRKLIDLVSLPADIIAGFVGGLLGGGGDIIGAALELFGNFLQSIKDFLGIHSPSTKFFEIAKNCIDGLVNGIKSCIGLAASAVTDLATSVINAIAGVASGIGGTLKTAFGSVDWGVVFSGIFGRCHAGDGFELAGKIMNAGEAGVFGNLSNGFVAAFKQVFCSLNPHGNQLLNGGCAVSFPIEGGKTTAGIAGQVR